MKNNCKTILVVVPHQDDEVNVAGGIVATLAKNKNNKIIILYTTNGDYIYRAEDRIKECIKSCSVLGVSRKNIFFLGYSDQYSDGDSHLYNTNKVWTSRNGFSHTYLPSPNKEVSVLINNKHNDYNKRNFISDIESFIKEFFPNIIVCIDFDSHCDHRAASLACEAAIGRVINSEKGYRPQVFKGFAYPTAYYGADDYNELNIQSTHFITEKHSYGKMENPYYMFEERVRFPLSTDCVDKIIFRNTIFKSLKCHKSQVIVEKARSIINGDQVFFQRRTDNLLNEATIVVSSGDEKKLHDFLLFDCLDVLRGNSEIPVLDDCAWTPVDEKPQIEIAFNDTKQVDSIRIFNSINSDKCIDFKLFIDGRCVGRYKFADDLINDVKFEKPITCRAIKIIFEKGKKVSISELEILENNTDDIKFLFGADKGNFLYDYYADSSFKLTIYSYNGYEGKWLKPDDCIFYIDGKEVQYKDISYDSIKKKATIAISLKNDNRINTSFTIRRLKARHKAINYIINDINNIYLTSVVFFQKIYRKIFIEKNK